MHHEPEIHNLLRDIHDVIEAFTVDAITREAASAEYDTFYKRYNDLKKTATPETSENHIKGLLYLHNSINYCKLSCIIEKNGEIVPDCACGDVSLLKLLKSGTFEKNNPGTIQSFLLYSDAGMNIDLHLMHLKSSDSYYFVCITSSAFFNKKIFYNIALLLDKNNGKNNASGNPLAMDYFTQIAHDLSALVMAEDKKGHAIIAVMLVFNSIEKIFGHMGLESLRQISNVIKDNFANLYPLTPFTFIVSLNSYIVAYSVPQQTADTEMLNINNSKIDFNVHGITLPSRRSISRLDGLQSVYTFLEKLYIFENSGRQNTRSQ